MVMYRLSYIAYGMRGILARVLAALALLAVAAMLVAGCGRTVIYEDSPKWNCRTMGNMLCGGDFEVDFCSSNGGSTCRQLHEI